MIGFTRQILFKGKHPAAFLPILSSSRLWFSSRSIYIPFLTDSVNEGTIKSVHRKKGQWVKKDDPIACIFTEKVTVTVWSPHTGVVTKCHVKVGDKLQVGGKLFDVDPDAKKPQHSQNPDSHQYHTQSGQNAHNPDSSAGSGQSAMGRTMSPNTTNPQSNVNSKTPSGSVGAGQDESQLPNQSTQRKNLKSYQNEIKPRSGQQPPQNTSVPSSDKDTGPIPKKSRPGQSDPDPNLGPQPTQKSERPSDKIFGKGGDKAAEQFIDKPTDKPFGENLNDNPRDKPRGL